ncbi:hypothetical protein M901_0200 [Bacteriovorax sp. DB6_IX]|nr:hypothetical protein M901_0200 [Bacteriovorax sp. DB6_IX]
MNKALILFKYFYIPILYYSFVIFLMKTKPLIPKKIPRSILRSK